MIEFLTGIAIGLIIGWNFLHQPEWIKQKLNEIRSKLKI